MTVNREVTPKEQPSPWPHLTAEHEVTTPKVDVTPQNPDGSQKVKQQTSTCLRLKVGLKGTARSQAADSSQPHLITDLKQQTSTYLCLKVGHKGTTSSQGADSFQPHLITDLKQQTSTYLRLKVGQKGTDRSQEADSSQPHLITDLKQKTSTLSMPEGGSQRNCRISRSRLIQAT